MRNLIPSRGLAITLLLAAPAWAAPGVTTLTTPKLPANATQATSNRLSASSPNHYNIVAVPEWFSAMPGLQVLSEVPQPASAALHFSPPTRLIL